MDTAEAWAPANIALVKYWGKRDEALVLPETDSLSVSLGSLGTRTRLARRSGPDTCTLNGAPVPPDSAFMQRLRAFLDLFRLAPAAGFAVETQNDVPTGAGVASSASGFAALVLALDQLNDWRLPPRALSVLARLGSGSACRSLAPGFVHWHRGSAVDGLDSSGEVLPYRWPELRLGLVLVSTAPKSESSRGGMRRTRETSALYRTWPAQVAADLAHVLAALPAHDFAALGAAAETNALAMHATMLAAQPPLCYWQPDSVALMQRVWGLRRAGWPLYFTMDAGPNLKLLFPAADTARVVREFPALTLITPFSP